jgi:hypothetical protein
VGGAAHACLQNRGDASHSEAATVYAAAVSFGSSIVVIVIVSEAKDLW